MFITITSRKADSVQIDIVENFLSKFLPRLRRQPDVEPVYHFKRQDKSDEITVTVWDNDDALKASLQIELNKAERTNDTNNLRVQKEDFSYRQTG